MTSKVPDSNVRIFGKVLFESLCDLVGLPEVARIYFGQSRGKQRETGLAVVRVKGFPR